MPDYNCDILDWHKTQSTGGQNISVELKKQLFPREKPFNFGIAIDDGVTQMEPVEYLIGYSNGPTAIGVAKQKELGIDQPLTIQIGSWKDPLSSKDVYVGCTVLVKNYYRAVHSCEKTLKYIARTDPNFKAGFPALFYNDRLYSNAIACEWAILKKPTLKPSLGQIVDFQTENHKGRQLFYGYVKDQENDIDVGVYNDQWPIYIRNPVKKEMPVVLNWIEIEDGPYYVYYTKDAFPTMLPERDDLEFEMGEKMYGGKWFGWVDTCFKSI